MYSRVRSVDFRISKAATRPIAVRGGESSRWEMMKRKALGQAHADGVLVAERENADDALDGFRRVDGVQRGVDQVAGFGGFERHFDRFAVAHFADENQFGRLAQSGAQGQREGGRIGVKFALVNRGALVRDAGTRSDLRW